MGNTVEKEVEVGGKALSGARIALDGEQFVSEMRSQFERCPKIGHRIGQRKGPKPGGGISRIGFREENQGNRGDAVPVTNYRRSAKTTLRQ